MRDCSQYRGVPGASQFPCRNGIEGAEDHGIRGSCAIIFPTMRGRTVTQESRFLLACQGKAHDTVPVWFMRQAGRYQESYRALRTRYSMLELARSPRLMRDVTVRPVEELGVDAAILFSDIMVPLTGLGLDFDIQENVGPVVRDPIRTAGQVAQIPPFRSDLVDYVYEGTQLTVEALGPIPLIGFAGAPFTLASYLVEGRPSRTYRATKEMMWNNPAVFQGLLEVLSDMVIEHLRLQAGAGAQALQVFDSWIGALGQADYQRTVLPHMMHIFGALKNLGIPLIYFGVGTQHLLSAMAATGATVIGVDWRTNLPEVRHTLGAEVVLMGNLDPERVVAGTAAALSGAEELVKQMAGDPRYIFNLGHGVPKETNPEVLRELVSRVHEWGRLGEGS